MITLYSTNCPKCVVLQKKLIDLNIDFKVTNDIKPLIKRGFLEAPVLQIDNEYLNFSQAIKWIKEQQ